MNTPTQRLFPTRRAAQEAIRSAGLDRRFAVVRVASLRGAYAVECRRPAAKTPLYLRADGTVQ